MKRATELFTFEEMPSSSAYVALTWRTRSEPDPDESFLSVAVTNWEMVVTRQASSTWLTVRGPETKASTAGIPRDAEFFGITFSLGTYMPHLDMRGLVDGELTPPPASRGSVWLDGSAWELPAPGNADVFVERLVRAGLLVHDPVAAAALREDEDRDEADQEADESDHDGLVGRVSTRTVERRVARATGMTRGTIRQIRRAQRAAALLDDGAAPLDVARRVGYTDQPHMTRSVKRFVGLTPSQIAARA